MHRGEIVLVRQYRHATGEVLLEIPAGTLDPGEEPHVTASRELAEEVGLAPRSLEHLATYYTTPGFSNETFRLYLCTEADEADVHPDEGEVLEIERRPLASVRGLLTSGEVRDAKTLLGLAFLALRSE